MTYVILLYTAVTNTIPAEFALFATSPRRGLGRLSPVRPIGLQPRLGRAEPREVEATAAGEDVAEGFGRVAAALFVARVLRAGGVFGGLGHVQNSDGGGNTPPELFFHGEVSLLHLLDDLLGTLM